MKQFSVKKYIVLPLIFLIVLSVLGTGIFIGSRFINFASSVSVSKQNIFKSLASTLPGLQGLDNSKVEDAIRNGKSINILLLGYGGSGHSGNYLTDSMLVIHFDFATNKVSFISVPRDLWVKIPTRGYAGSYAKINSAYAVGMDAQHYPDKLPQFTGTNGGGDESKYEVASVTGIPIDYYASVDFSGFKDIVDTLGGVQVNVENSFTDYTYPNGDENVDGPSCYATDPSSSCRYLVVHFDAGPQYMDGTRALEYVRSRHAAGVEGSDFARSRRQQLLISAIEQKAMQLGALTKIFALMNDIQGHFQTDLSVAEIKDLAGEMSKLDFANAQRISITDQDSALLVSTYSQDGQWILEPAAGIDDYSQVHKYIREELSAQN